MRAGELGRVDARARRRSPPRSTSTRSRGRRRSGSGAGRRSRLSGRRPARATSLRVIVVRTRRIQYGPRVFRPLGEAELARLDDDALIAYVRQARLAGDPSARVALAVLVYGHWHNVARRVALKVPPAAVEDVAVRRAGERDPVGVRRVLGGRVPRLAADDHRAPDRGLPPAAAARDGAARGRVARGARGGRRGRRGRCRAGARAAERRAPAGRRAGGASRGAPRPRSTGSARRTCTRSRRASGARCVRSSILR